MYRNLIKLYTDREFSGRNITLNNVSHSTIRSLEVIGETVENNEGEKSIGNPSVFYDCEKPILNVAENELEIPYTLRSLGNYYDSFNVLTGEYTQSIKSISFTGDESWNMATSNDTNAVFTYRTNTESIYSAGTMCNAFEFKGIAGGYNNALSNGVGLYKWLSSGNQYNYFVVPLTVASSIDEWKAYLQANEVEFRYVLAEPVVTQAEAVEVKASIPDTVVELMEGNDLGSVKMTVQIKE